MNAILRPRPWFVAAVLALSALICTVGLHAQQPRLFTSLFAFTAGTQPHPPYVGGRFSSGLVFPEYLRNALEATGHLGQRWAWAGGYSFESLPGGRNGHLYSLSVQSRF